MWGGEKEGGVGKKERGPRGENERTQNEAGHSTAVSQRNAQLHVRGGKLKKERLRGKRGQLQTNAWSGQSEKRHENRPVNGDPRADRGC